MEVKEIIELMKAVSDNGLTKFELEQDQMKLVMRREKEIVTVSGGMIAGQTNPVESIMYTERNVPHAEGQSEAPKTPQGNLISCPLVGTFYSAPSPDAENFVKVGDHVKKGQILGIVEAMKLMNEIESEYDGVVEEILVNNEDIVEYGQPLFVIR